MTRPNLYYHDIDLTRGLSTIFREEDTSLNGLAQAKNVDLFEVFRALSQIPGNEHLFDLELSVDLPIQGIFPFEFVDAKGDTRRLGVVARGVEAGTWTGFEETSPGTFAVYAFSEATGPLGLEPSHGPISKPQFAETFQDDVYVTTDFHGLQWSGINRTGIAEAHHWGLYAPAQFPFDTNDPTAFFFGTGQVWSAINASTTTPADSPFARFAQNSKSFDHSGTSGAQIGIERTGQNANFTPTSLNTEDFAHLWFFIPDDRIPDLALLQCIRVRYGGSGLTDSDEIRFDQVELAEGWNLFRWSLADGTARNNIQQTGAGATLTSIDTLRITVNFASTTPPANSDDFRASLFYTTKDGIPKLALGGAGNPNATYRYRVTFVDDEGFESNAGPISASITATSDEVDLTEVPRSEDSRVIQRRIYRDKEDGTFLFVGTLDDNNSTSFTDNTAEPNPNTDTPPLAGSSTEDHSPPPPVGKLVKFDNRIIGIDSQVPFRIVFSERNAPRQFPLLNFIDLEDEITSIGTHNRGLLAWSNDKMFLLTPSGNTFTTLLVDDQLGCNGPRTNVEVKGLQMVMFEDKVFIVTNDLADPWLLNGPVFDQFRNVARTELRNAFMVHDRGRFRVLFFMRSTAGSDFNKILVWQYGTQGFSQITGEGPGTDPQDIRVGAWYEIEFPSGIDPTAAGVLDTDESDFPELYIGIETRSRVSRFANDETDWSFATGANVAINAVIETAPFPIGSRPTPGGGMRMAPDGRGEVRSIAINGAAANSSAWTVTVEYLSDANGNVIGSSSRTVTLGVDDTSPILPMPPAGVRGNWARVRLENNVLDDVGTIKSLRVYYIPRGDFVGEQAA